MTHTTLFTLIAIAPTAITLCCLALVLPVAMLARYRGGATRNHIAASPCLELVDMARVDLLIAELSIVENNACTDDMAGLFLTHTTGSAYAKKTKDIVVTI